MGSHFYAASQMCIIVNIKVLRSYFLLGHPEIYRELMFGNRLFGV